MTRATGRNGTTSPERARLAAELRELKARTGLSLARLEERTPYSKSSWERYLNGKTLPSRQAVLELCRLAGESSGRCLALWEIAESESSGRAREAVPPARAELTDADTSRTTDVASDTAEESGHAVRKGTATALLAALCAVATGAVALTLFLLPHPSGTAQPSPSAPLPGLAPLCGGAACEGGNPMTRHCGSHPASLASHHTATGAAVELRYSKECGASWARVWGTHVGDRIDVTAAGHTHSTRIRDDTDAGSYVYTPMVATGPGTAVRACFRPATDAQPECVDSQVPASSARRSALVEVHPPA